MPGFSFTTTFQDKKGKARIGEIVTRHGEFETPQFVAVGSKATIKSIAPWEFKEMGTNIFFVNTYHMMVTMGEDVVEKCGGLHKIMAWNGPIMTDSGGFQAFSLSNNINDDNCSGAVIKNSGVYFKSHIDGSSFLLTADKSILVQKKLGADIILCLDHCISNPSNYESTKKAMIRTHKWACESIKALKKYKICDQALFGIVHGGIYKDLRITSAKFINSLPFDGYAIGGVAVGESKKEMEKAVVNVVPYLDPTKPRHLLGVGEVEDIFNIINLGIDTFDCVIPTRLARTGWFFVSPRIGNKKNRFRIDISKAIYKSSGDPIDENCQCRICKTFSKSYLHHLFKSKELLFYRLASYHNLYFINNLVSLIRKSIKEGELLNLEKEWLRK